MNHKLPILLLLHTFLLIKAQFLDLLMPVFEQDLANKRTATRIFLDFEIFTLTEEQSNRIFDIFKSFKTNIHKPSQSLSPTLKNVLEDLTKLKSSLKHITSATSSLLDKNTPKPDHSPCTYVKIIVNSNSFQNFLESLILISAKIPPEFDFSDDVTSDKHNEKFQLIIDTLIHLKGTVHEFFASLEKQYSLLLDLENFILPTFVAHDLDLGKCIRHSGQEKFKMEHIKYYSSGVYITVKLTQFHDFQSYNSLRPIPIAGISLDLDDLYAPINNNATYVEQICTTVNNIKNCQLKPYNTPCTVAIIAKHVSKILQTCPIKKQSQSQPFLTLEGIYIPNNAKISFLDPKTQEKIPNISTESPPLNLPYLLTSEYTVEIITQNSSFLFGPTSQETNIIPSYFSVEDLTLIQYFLKPYYNPTYQIYFSLGSTLFLCFIVLLFLLYKLFIPKSNLKKQSKYLASFHKYKPTTIIKINK